MLDIDFIRNNPDLIKVSVKRRKSDFNVDELLKVDDMRRDLITRIEIKRAEQNKTTDLIPQQTDIDKKTQLIEEMKGLKAEIKELEEELNPVKELWQGLMMQLPNIADPSVPDGKSEADNVVVKEWGTKPQFDFEPKDHIELMENLGMIDLERGTKVHGFRGYFMKGAGAKLQWAIWNFARDFYTEAGFEEFVAPAIIRPDYFYATGHLPAEADDLFQTQDGDYLSGTAEVPMMAYYSNEILDEEDLPFKALAFSPCYRREAGSHSKDTKGLIRVHEFYKLEQLVLCAASHEETVKFHEEINTLFESFLEKLELPYQRLLISMGDLSKSKVKQYDVEAWVPSQNQYRELSSASYFHDFQTRRFNIRYRDTEGEIRFVHSLNNTAAATPRLLVALVENFQQADGSIMLPTVLHKYFGAPMIKATN
mgnify:FL=1